jgi:hypothetical protein
MGIERRAVAHAGVALLSSHEPISVGAQCDSAREEHVGFDESLLTFGATQGVSNVFPR